MGFINQQTSLGGPHCMVKKKSAPWSKYRTSVFPLKFPCAFSSRFHGAPPDPPISSLGWKTLCTSLVWCPKLGPGSRVGVVKPWIFGSMGMSPSKFVECHNKHEDFTIRMGKFLIKERMMTMIEFVSTLC